MRIFSSSARLVNLVPFFNEEDVTIMRKKIVMLQGAKEAILTNPSLGCTGVSMLSQILNFKRNNMRALKIRNYAMNNCNSIYVEYEEDKTRARQEV